MDPVILIHVLLTAWCTLLTHLVVTLTHRNTAQATSARPLWIAHDYVLQSILYMLNGRSPLTSHKYGLWWLISARYNGWSVKRRWRCWLTYVISTLSTNPFVHMVNQYTFGYHMCRLITAVVLYVTERFQLRFTMCYQSRFQFNIIPTILRSHFTGRCFLRA